MLDFDESDMRLAKDDDYIMHAADGCATPGTDPATPPRSPLYRPGPSTPTDQGSTTPRFLFGQTPTKEHYFGSYHSSHHHGASAGTPVQDGTPEQFPQGTPDDGGLATPGSVSPMKRRYEADTPRKRVARSRGGFDEWSGANGLTAACADGGGFDAPVALGGSFTNFPREESLNCSFRINGLNRRRDVSTLGALDPDMYGDVGCCDDDDAASFSSSDDGLGGGFASRDLTELGELGRGSYGVVYKVRHAFDDQYFAVKKSLRPFSGLVSKENRLQEVYSLAALPSCLHIVRYHDCWVERNIFYIRFEYCEGGTIASQPYDSWTYPDILSLFFQITTGLRCLHQSDIVHLDVKAENIYITRKNGETVFKLGDFGLVRQIKDDTKHWLGENDDEGDARYLCQAFLRGSGNAKAADVFSLAATVYEIARKEQLPCQGDEWQDVRNSPAADIECAYEPGFVNLITTCMDINPSLRPDCASVLRNSIFDTLKRESSAAETVRRLEAQVVDFHARIRQAEARKRDAAAVAAAAALPPLPPQAAAAAALAPAVAATGTAVSVAAASAEASSSPPAGQRAVSLGSSSQGLSPSSAEQHSSPEQMAATAPRSLVRPGSRPGAAALPPPSLVS